MLAGSCVDLPAVFDAVGGGAELSEARSVIDGGPNAWGTLGGLLERGKLVWRFRPDCDDLWFGLIHGAEPVPLDWRAGREHPRGYEILSDSNGWVYALGKTLWGKPPNWRTASRGSVVECSLDMDVRTMSFAVDDNPECLVFKDIKAPVRPMIWGGNAKLLLVRGPAGALVSGF